MYVHSVYMYFGFSWSFIVVTFGFHVPLSITCCLERHWFGLEGHGGLVEPDNSICQGFSACGVSQAALLRSTPHTKCSLCVCTRSLPSKDLFVCTCIRL